MKLKIIKIIFTGIISAGLASPINAATINYIFSGFGSGTLNSQSFVNESFAVTVTADTNNVMYLESLGTVGADGLSGSISLGGGFGTGSFTDPLFIFGGDGYDDIGFGGGGLDSNLIGTWDDATGLASYDMKSDFSLISGLTNQFLNQFNDIQTSNGLLSYSSMSDYTFEATVSAVPLPASVWLFGSGILALLGVSNRKNT